LWDSQNQCKPAYYAAANVGNNYHALDSLISYADTLQESKYDPASWASLVSVLVSAKNAMTQNYSSTISAADVLGEVKDDLKTAIDGLIVVGVVNAGNNIRSFALSQNYPNPFNPSTVISYQLSVGCVVKLSIYNMLGQKIKTLVNSFQSAGEHSITWDAMDAGNNQMSSGVYFYKLESNQQTLQKKMLLVR
jgi:hypothetical protein